MSGILQIKNVESLILALEQKGANHQSYFHYTTWESAKKIIEGHSFLLTRGNSLAINDQHEALMKGSWDVWNRTYIGSFSYGASENMAMWGVYGLPWEDAVRLEIPKKYMLRWIKSIEYVELWDKNRAYKLLENPNVSLLDIVYVNGTKSTNNLVLTYKDRSWQIAHIPEFSGIDTNPQMTGYIKNYAWHYENEVRLKIRLPRATGTEKIRIQMPEQTVESIQLTTGPYFIEKNDALYESMYKEGRIKESGFKGLVKYRPLCDYCRYEHFERR